MADFVDAIIMKGTQTPVADKSGAMDYEAMCKQAESIAAIAETVIVESATETLPGDAKACAALFYLHVFGNMQLQCTG